MSAAGRVEAREAWIARLAQALSADGRFAAAWLYGSLGRGEGDALSDVDLALVVADEYVADLCRRAALTAAETTPQRLALFSQFGRPVVIHENLHNAVAGGTFTFVMYADSGWMVDWSLRPQMGAQRPANTRLLFDHVGIPLASPVEAHPPAFLQADAAERAAFFWMMAAVTAKYLSRRDRVFGLVWLGHLAEIVAGLEQLNGQTPPTDEWIRGASPAELFSALRGLCARVGRLDVPGNPAARAEVERLILRAQGG